MSHRALGLAAALTGVGKAGSPGCRAGLWSPANCWVTVIAGLLASFLGLVTACGTQAVVLPFSGE